MYTRNLNVKEMCQFLGLGRNKVLELCRTGLNGFPAVKVGNRYQADEARLSLWRNDLYDNKFKI